MIRKSLSASVTKDASLNYNQHITLMHGTQAISDVNAKIFAVFKTDINYQDSAGVLRCHVSAECERQGTLRRGGSFALNHGSPRTTMTCDPVAVQAG